MMDSRLPNSQRETLIESDPRTAARAQHVLHDLMLVELTGWEYATLRRQPRNWRLDLVQALNVRGELRESMAAK